MIRTLFAILLLFGAACVGGPKQTPLSLGPSHLVEGGDATTIMTNRGPGLALSKWVPDQAPKAVILALHGFGDYGPSTFGAAGTFWARRGLLTYAYDQRGFGRNESRGKWPGGEVLAEDFRAVLAAVRASHPGLPVFVVGHSMGGAVAIIGLAGTRDANGVILAAPAVWGGDLLAVTYRVAAWAGALVLPDKRWSGDGIVRIQASDNMEVLRALGRDPVYLHRPSSREFMGLIRLMDDAVEAAPRLSVPLLMLYGENDEVAPKEAVLAAFESVPGEKEIILYPDGWHFLFRDLQAERVWSDVADWIESRTE